MSEQTLARLAARQKRASDWDNFLQTEVQDPEVKEKTAETLKQYRALLARCWEENRITGGEEQQIRDFERQLEFLNEEARVRTVGRKAAGA